MPTQNLDNAGTTRIWRRVKRPRRFGRKQLAAEREGADDYKITYAAEDPDIFSDPKWPTQSLGELIARAFAGRMIETEDHPALLRKIGAKQSLS